MRGGRSFQLAEGSPVFDGDVITASDGTSITLESVIGGRATVARGASAVLNGLRGVQPLDPLHKPRSLWNSIINGVPRGNPQISPYGIGVEG